MTHLSPKPLTFDEFVVWYPANSGKRYELRQSIVVEKPTPTGKHSQIAGLVSGKLFEEIDRLQSRDFIPRKRLVKATDDETRYEPDVVVQNGETIDNDPKWQKESVVTRGESIRLIVEVIDFNDLEPYLASLAVYEKMGVPE